METKNPDAFVISDLEPVLLENHFLVSPQSPGGGGLALLWSNDVSLTVLAHSQNFIDTQIDFKGASFHVTFVYGEPDIPRRQAVWDSITDLGTDRSTPWLLSGDFNEIIDNSEKTGGHT